MENYTKISLNEKACCSITEFYEKVAIQLDKEVSENISYDCSKIDVSTQIFEDIRTYYENNGWSKSDFGMAWVCYGPKTNENLQNYEVMIQEGFISYKEEN